MPNFTEADARARVALSAGRFRELTTDILNSMARVVDGKPEALHSALVCLLAEGHLLIEDVPGVGKTMLARSLGASISATVRRIQFTPDLLPGDVTGVSVYNPLERTFEFKPGAIFASIVIADEINRSSPKTQSALLEAMEERQVTVDGTTHHVPAPFLVVATQNPIEMEGTYALPEAQRDRFMMQVSMGYPRPTAEVQMLRQRDTGDPLRQLTPVASAREVSELIQWARQIHIAPAIEEYAVALANATRTHPDIRLGASPRATLHLVRAAKVRAALDGRDFVIPDDLTALLAPVFSHRLILSRSGNSSVPAVLQQIATQVAVPLGGQ